MAIHRTVAQRFNGCQLPIRPQTSVCQTFEAALPGSMDPTIQALGPYLLAAVAHLHPWPSPVWLSTRLMTVKHNVYNPVHYAQVHLRLMGPWSSKGMSWTISRPIWAV